MITLDCESYDSAMKSICDSYAIEKCAAEKFLLELDLGAEYDNKVIYKSGDYYLKELFDTTFGSPKNPITRVAWFHLTRTPRTTNFSDGILPLGEILDTIWDTLSSLLESENQINNLAKMRQHGVNNFHYNLKCPDSLHHGPYAMLVRAAAFNAHKICNHDYLETPEIIEDICSGYETQFGEGIHDTILSKLNKCIVKFESEKSIEENLLAPVLLYCWCEIRNAELSSCANTCFDSAGVAISSDSIISVNFL
jgi:hypothetical protein